MSDDRTQGLTEMHDAGSPKIAQEIESFGVYGMPPIAVGYGAVDKVKNPKEIVMFLIYPRS